MIKNRKYFSILSCFILLASCSSSTKTIAFNVIAPKGAPTAVLLDYANQSNVTFSSAPAAVKAAFLGNDVDAIIFDTFTGLTLIEKQSAPFVLARVITAGNLFLVSTGNDLNQNFEDSDTIVSFGENLIPDKIYKKVYSNITPDYYKAGVGDLGPLLCTGKIEGNTVDYLIMSEPAITKMLNNNSCATSAKASIRENLTTSFNNLSSLNGFPQAGLFIRKTLDNNVDMEKDVKGFIETIDDNLAELNYDVENIISRMNNTGTTKEQNDLFGFDSETLKKVQLDTNGERKNSLGFTTGSYDLEAFYKFMNIQAPQGTSYSKYFK